MSTKHSEREWVIIARSAIELIDGITYGKQDLVRDKIAYEHGVKRSTLQRSIYIYRTISKMNISEPAFVSLLYSLSFSASELLEKMCRIDLELAKILAEQVRAQELTVRQLKGIIAKYEKPASLRNRKSQYLLDEVLKDHEKQTRWLALDEVPKVRAHRKDDWLDAAGVDYIARPVDKTDRQLAVISITIGKDVSARHFRKRLTTQLLKSMGLIVRGWYVKLYIDDINIDRIVKGNAGDELSMIDHIDLVFVRHSQQHDQSVFNK